jgi:hypothetical protein
MHECHAAGNFESDIACHCDRGRITERRTFRDVRSDRDGICFAVAQPDADVRTDSQSDQCRHSFTNGVGRGHTLANRKSGTGNSAGHVDGRDPGSDAGELP